MRYLKGTTDRGLWYPNDDNFDLTAYSNSDYGRCKRDYKSTSAGSQFFGTRLVTWQCKKQTSVSTSTCEAEYIAAASCCSQIFWIQQQLRDYGLHFSNTPIYVDNTAAIAVTKNPYLERFGAPCTMLKKHEHGKFNEKVEEGYSMRPPGKGPDWMFDYSGLFDSFNMPPMYSDEDVAVQMLYDTQNTPHEPVQPSSTSIPTVQTTDDSLDTDENPIQPAAPEPDVDNLVPDLEDLNLNNLDPQVEVPRNPVGRINRIHPQENIIGSPLDGVKTRHQLSSGGLADILDFADVSFCAHSCFISQVEPRTVTEALKEESWVDAMQEELLQFKKLGVWQLVERPNGAIVIGTRWVLRCKKYDHGIIVRNNACLVVLGFRQIEGLDYNEVFTPAAQQFSAFLHGVISETVYVSQPPGFEDPLHRDQVYKLDNALYGLHQAPRAWYEGEVRDELNGEMKFFLGLQVDQYEAGIFIHQTKYVGDILSRFNMSDAKPAGTPLAVNHGITPDEKGELVDVTLYRGMIGSLMYLTASRPDIMFATCLCARYQSKPRVSHLIAVKRIMRYLKGTTDLGLWYPNDDNFDLTAYNDSDYGGCKRDYKSTSAGSEYIAAASCCSQIIWIQQQLRDYGLHFSNTPIYVDNTAVIAVTKNPYLEPFGAPCTMLKKHEQGKFNEKVEEGYFLGYSTPNKRVYNRSTQNVEEWYHVDVQRYSIRPPGKGPDWMFDYSGLFDSFNMPPLYLDEDVAVQMLYDAQNTPHEQVQPSSTSIPTVQTTDDSLDTDENPIQPAAPEPDVDNLVPDLEDLNLNNLDPQVEVPRNPVEPRTVTEALKEESWVDAMQEELLQFKKLGVWLLVERPNGAKVIGTRWVLRCKKDDHGIIVRNKASIRIFLAYASFKKLKVYQMDVKSAFLHGVISETVYVSQPPGFEDPLHRDQVYKLDKALYGLYQAPRAWYETLSTHLLNNGFRRGVIDCTLFIREKDGDLLFVQVYVDDIIFGSTNDGLCKEFEKVMKEKFEMSSMGEMKFFLGLQVDQSEEFIFIHQTKYAGDILSRFSMSDAKPASTPLAVNHGIMPDEKGELIYATLYRGMIESLMYLTSSRPDIMFATCLCARYQSKPRVSHLIAVKRIMRYLKGTTDLGLWYPNDDNFDLTAYNDSDYGGCKRDYKSTSAGCQFFGTRLVTWQCKKQTSVSTSTCEAEYIAAASCCSQIIWIQQQLRDYGLHFSNTPIYVDNTAVIAVTKNPGKFNEKVEEGYFLGYSTPNKRLYNRSTQNVEEWYHVDVQRYPMPPPGKGPDWMFDYSGLFDSFNMPPLYLDEDVAVQMLYDAQNTPHEPVQPSSTSIPTVQTTDDSLDTFENPIQPAAPEPDVDNLVPDLEDLNLNNLDPQVEVPRNPVEPRTVTEALKEESWVDAMQEELLQFKKLGVWLLVERPNGAKVIGTRWVLRCKTDDHGIIVRNKASIRIFLAYASFKKLKVYQMDVKSAFLHGVISETVYVSQPPGFEDPLHRDQVYKLDKALYGLYQAPRAWYETLSTHLLNNGFRRGVIDCTLFIRDKDGDLLFVQVYVDDIIFGSTNDGLCKEFEKVMKEKFEMSSIGEMKFFLGLQVDQSEEFIFIHQTKYAGDILSRFNMSDAKPAGTPLAVNHGIMPDEKGELIYATLYRGMIESRMYLTSSRPDIMFATCLCARYQSKPRVSHLIAVKRIMRYLKGTTDLGLWYPNDDNFDLTAYNDSDYGGCKRDYKSTSAGCQFFGTR
ncbi:hypothetical protein E3N88_32283 [Mikania micrantha]|uniref:Reverse transcriptase Ty1/copia-type domain-containing protein n=1 Tax=Mikania micrantha TaxID=192012 RepID=A0A5N6M824_9ASTR|nr:hypothetical protein E3N88_32283 [Mikania micrantha]